MNSKTKAQTLARRYKLMKGCVVCGYKEHHVALHYNHIDPSTKVRNVSRAASIKTVKEEIRKCEVLCANCHAVKSLEEKHYLNSPVGPTRADKDRQKLVRRLAASRRRTLKLKGRCEGRRPYDNQAVIQQIINYRTNRKAYQHIADILNSEGTPSPAGSTWTATSVRRVYLRRPKNYGR